MTGSSERIVSSEHSTINSPRVVATSTSSQAGPSSHNFQKTSVWSGILVSAFAIFNSYSEPRGKKVSCAKNLGLTTSLKRIVNSGSMRRILGLNRPGVSSSRSDIWLLGTCYKVAEDDSITDVSQSEGFASFVEDFSSRILLTYRKGFTPIGDSKYTSDVNWGCMLRSSQMLVAQALLHHHLGRSWRKTLDKQVEQKYIEILHMFGDSESSAYSIHNLVEAGKSYGLSPGSWVGPYAMCRTWETLYRCKIKDIPDDELSSVIAMYVVSGDEDGERGGAPVICIDDITRHCFECSKGQADWLPIILLVPLVLGLDKLNPRYLPLLGATFRFPQSLGLLGGRPGASTYIIGLQDDNAFYLDPHEVQQVTNIAWDNLEVDTTSYHSNILRHMPLDSIDPSVAIGFYCRDKSDFDDFCIRASELANESNGAPLFTVTETRKASYCASYHDNVDDNAEFPESGSCHMVLEGESEGCAHEDDWQLL